jgi:type I restriction enzyme S subunit
MPQNQNPKTKTTADRSTANQKPSNSTAKPGFKLTKLGWIPTEWEVRTLSQISKITMGQSPKSEFYNQDEIGVPLINGPTEFTDRYPVKIQWTTEGNKYCGQDDILLCVRGSSTGRINISNDRYCIGRGVAAVRARRSEDHVYLEYQLRAAIDRILRLTTGSTFPSVDSKTLKLIKIPLPPLKEQTRIANCLTTWDRAITTTRKLLQQLEERKKGLMQGLLSGAVRVPGFIGEWEETRIGSLILESKIIGEGNKVDRRIKVRLDLNGVLARDVKGNESIDSTTYYRRSAGQFIYGKQNLHKGAMGLIPSYLDGFESTSDVPAFDFKRGVDPDWFLFYMARPNFYKWLEVISTGTGSKRIQPKVLFKVKINLPTLPEQAAIAKILTTADQEIVLYKRKLAKLEAQKKGLMQQLLTGQKRLSA